jgi:hypothetical protein
MSKFGQVLEGTFTDRGDSQGAVADYINDWLENEDLETELDQLVRTARKKDRDQLERVVSIIEDHLRRRSKASSWHVTQAAVSKWKKGRASPTPEKWPAIARYTDLPLIEVFDMISRDKEPQSIPALRQQLAAAQQTNAELTRQLEQRGDDLARAERALRLSEAAQARLEARLDDLEKEVASVGNDGECEEGARIRVS